MLRRSFLKLVGAGSAIAALFPKIGISKQETIDNRIKGRLAEASRAFSSPSVRVYYGNMLPPNPNVGDVFIVDKSEGIYSVGDTFMCIDQGKWTQQLRFPLEPDAKELAGRRFWNRSYHPG